MKFSELWLREWVDPSMNTDELAHCLTMAGLEVDEVSPASLPLDKVVVGLVSDIQPHPDADRLRVCTVDVGDTDALSIVCGASNVAQGMKVPVARIGAKLPNGLKIKKSKIRGVLSQGMICSETELDIAEQSPGIMALADSAKVGTEIIDQLQLNDSLIDIDLTPNRGDCLSIAGIARDVGAITKTPVSYPVVKELAQQHEDVVNVVVQEPSDCANYVGRVIRDIDGDAQTPFWMKEKLRRSGLRSLGPVVDVTNYVMLELGQPMHTFDLAKLTGDISVRYANAEESITLLNEDTVKLASDMLIIADEAQVLAVAGIMGGQSTAVSKSTTAIFLESAWFAPGVVAGRARKLGLSTDSSHRFERGVDPKLQEQAIHRATELLIDIVGGQPGPLRVERSDEDLPVSKAVLLRSQRIERMLGVAINFNEIDSILAGLGMRTERVPDGWLVTPPSYRFDINIEVDLIEEIGRIYGYDNIPNQLAPVYPCMLPDSDSKSEKNRLANILVDRGYQEVINYSFVEPQLQALFAPNLEPLALQNPLSLELSVMRTTQLIGLVKSLMFNRNRQQTRVRIFETGLNFVSTPDELTQERLISGLVSGPVAPEQPFLQSSAADFFDIKADVEALLQLTGNRDQFQFVSGTHQAMHPGQCAEIKMGGKLVGHVGRLHPQIESQLNLGSAVYVFELKLDDLMDRAIPEFRECSKFPHNRRDIAVVVDKSIPAGNVVNRIQEMAGPSLQSVVVFDVYEGEGVENGKKSLALGLTLSDSSRTLTDENIDKIINNVILDLAEMYQARLRY